VLLRSSAFVRAAKRAVRRDRNASASLRATLGLLEADAFDPRLRTHKLKGEFAGMWSCSAGHDLRIVFAIVKSDGGESIVLVSCGTHDQVY
jgi:addiction module RelE/StbE family toxin